MSGTISSTIVVGVDGSPESVVATQWGAAQARRRRADLLILSALRPHHLGLPNVMLPGEDDERRPGAGPALVDMVTQRLRHRFPDLRVTGTFEQRDPRVALVDAGRAALMTVIGNRGTGRLPEALSGSVALYVTSHARTPIAVVPRHPAPASGPVLVGVDPNGSSQAAIDLAFDEATLRGADLVAVLAGDRVGAHQGFARRPVHRCRRKSKRITRCCPNNSADGRRSTRTSRSIACSSTVPRHAAWRVSPRSPGTTVPS